MHACVSGNQKEIKRRTHGTIKATVLAHAKHGAGNVSREPGLVEPAVCLPAVTRVST